jgi:ABC-type antimicrobial peptide transport system permease subunit
MGLLVGAGLGALSGTVVAGSLFGANPSSPSLMLAVTAVIVVPTAIASYIPLIRAARVDPAVLLREA